MEGLLAFKSVLSLFFCSSFSRAVFKILAIWNPCAQLVQKEADGERIAANHDRRVALGASADVVQRLPLRYEERYEFRVHRMMLFGWLKPEKRSPPPDVARGRWHENARSLMIASPRSSMAAAAVERFPRRVRLLPLLRQAREAREGGATEVAEAPKVEKLSPIQEKQSSASYMVLLR